MTEIKVYCFTSIKQKMQVTWPPLMAIHCIKMTNLTGLPGSGFAGTDNFCRTLGFCGQRTKSRERLCLI